MDRSADTREARLKAIVVTNFTFVVGYLAFAIAAGWKQVACVILLGASALATIWFWYSAIHPRHRVNPPAPHSDDTPESN
jgi:hypothetical protein